MRGSSAAAIGLCCIALSGCIIIPLPEHGHSYGRASLGRADLSFLKEGETTREEVLLRLGAPDLALRSGDLLAYAWGGSGGFVLGYGGGPIAVHHLLALEFAPGGHLQRVRSSGSRWSWAADTLAQSEEGSPPPLTVLVDPLPDIWTRFDRPGRGEPRSRVRVGDFHDGRKAPFSGTLVAQVDLPRFPAAEIHLSQSAAETIRAAVAHQLREEGFLLVETDEDWTVSGDLRHFEYAFDGLLRLTRLDVSISVEGRQTNSLVTSRRTCAFTSIPLPQDVDRSLRSALEELQRQIARDAGLIGLLGATVRERGAPEP